MKTKNLLTCLHGSHMYGMQHALSDMDVYVVYDFYNKNYRPKRLVTQSINDESDTTKIYLENFINQVFKGTPQALEALFVPPNCVFEQSEDWPGIKKEIIDEVPHYLEEILETYKRTALNFFAKDDEKRNRHAFRLLINAKQLRSGSMNPRLSYKEIDVITKQSKLPYKFRLEEFQQQLFDCFNGDAQ